MKNLAFLYFSLTILILIKTGSAIRCYYCAHGDSCEDTKHSSVHSCTESDYPNLDKTVKTDNFHCLNIKIVVSGETKTLRGCSKHYCDNLELNIPDVTINECFSCNSDKCNSTSTISFSIGLITLMTLFLKFLN